MQNFWKWGRGILGAYETPAALLSGMVAQPVSGLAGLLAMPGGPALAARAVQKTQDALTYKPRTPEGQQGLESIAGLLSPITNALEQAKQASGDAGYGLLGPVGGALGETLPEAALMGLPLARKPGNLLQPNPMNAATQNQLGAIVYHGSPHKFDKFDSSKIGTGEGAQAYGHGLYFAENPNVASLYKENLGGPGVEIGGKVSQITPGSPEDIAIAHLEDAFFTKSSAPYVKAKNTLGSTKHIVGNDPRFDQAMKVLDEWGKAGAKPASTGSLYKVDLPDEHIAKMIDYDKTIKEQPEIYKALKNAGFGMIDRPGVTGADFVPRTQAQADALKNAGITGVRYLDGGSRGAGRGTSNYVVFPSNEGLLKILGRE